MLPLRPWAGVLFWPRNQPAIQPHILWRRRPPAQCVGHVRMLAAPQRAARAPHLDGCHCPRGTALLAPQEHDAGPCGGGQLDMLQAAVASCASHRSYAGRYAARTSCDAMCKRQYMFLRCTAAATHVADRCLPASRSSSVSGDLQLAHSTYSFMYRRMTFSKPLGKNRPFTMSRCCPSRLPLVPSSCGESTCGNVVAFVRDGSALPGMYAKTHTPSCTGHRACFSTLQTRTKVYNGHSRHAPRAGTPCSAPGCDS